MREAQSALPALAQRVGGDEGEDFDVRGRGEGERRRGRQGGGLFGGVVWVRGWRDGGVGEGGGGFPRGEGQAGFDGEVVAERAGEGGVAGRRSDLDARDAPVRDFGGGVVGRAADEDVVEAFGARVGRVRVDGDGAALAQRFLLRLAPPPAVQHAVARRAVFG